MIITQAISTRASLASSPAPARVKLNHSSLSQRSAYPRASAQKVFAVRDESMMNANDGANDAIKPVSPFTLDWRYETIAGRCAMAGYAIGASREAAEGVGYVEQLSRHGFSTGLVCIAIAWASIKPFEFNPQEYEANPTSLDGKKGLSGFLVVEALNFNAGVERLNGRACMVGLVGTSLLELIKGSPLF